MARVRERPHRGQRSRVTRIALQRRAQRRLGARVLGRIGRLARLLQVGIAERGVRGAARDVSVFTAACRERMRSSVVRASAKPPALAPAPAPAGPLPEGESSSFTARKVAANANSGSRSLIRFGLLSRWAQSCASSCGVIGVGAPRGEAPNPVAPAYGMRVVPLDPSVEARIGRDHVREAARERLVVPGHAVPEVVRVRALRGRLAGVRAQHLRVGELTRNDLECDVDHVVGQPAAVRVTGQVARERPEGLRVSRRRDAEVELERVDRLRRSWGRNRAGSDPGGPASTACTMSRRLVSGAPTLNSRFRIAASSGLTTNCPYSSASRSGLVRLNWSFFPTGITTSFTSGFPSRETCTKSPVLGTWLRWEHLRPARSRR